MKIRAKFKGVDTRKKKVYKIGQLYTLDFQICSRGYDSIKDQVEISKYSSGNWDENSLRTYPSLKSFLKNWEII